MKSINGKFEEINIFIKRYKLFSIITIFLYVIQLIMITFSVLLIAIIFKNEILFNLIMIIEIVIILSFLLFHGLSLYYLLEYNRVINYKENETAILIFNIVMIPLLIIEVMVNFNKMNN
jgi:hypothetical protein